MVEFAEQFDMGYERLHHADGGEERQWVAPQQITIFGSGVVGNATGEGFGLHGHKVRYVDTDPAMINRRRGEGKDIGPYEDVDWNFDIGMVSVPTPVRNGKINLSHVANASRRIGRGIRDTQNHPVIVMRSTILPGVTDGLVVPLLEQESGKKAGRDFSVAFNPEFLRADYAVEEFANPPVTVIGTNDQRAADTLQRVYKPFGAEMVVCSPPTAEMIKYVNNVYLAVKISYFNEVHAICDALGLDGDLIAGVVARSSPGMRDPEVGTRSLGPYGGACLPKDTAAFMAYCEALGLTHDMLKTAMQVNDRIMRQQEKSLPT